jgi:hypothetical protein
MSNLQNYLADVAGIGDVFLEDYPSLDSAGKEIYRRYPMCRIKSIQCVGKEIYKSQEAWDEEEYDQQLAESYII